MIRGSNAVSQVASEGGSIQLSGSMRRFLDTFKQSLLALLFITGTLSAGMLFVSYSDIFVQASWVLILYPSILSMRGVIGGLYSGRLSTGLHIGTINPKIFGNTKDFRTLVGATVALTFQSSLMIGGMTSMVSLVLWGISFVEILSIVSVVIATMGLTLLFVSPATVAVSVFAFSFGLDPDVIVYPLISVVSDVVGTLCFIFILESLFLFGSFGSYVIGVIIAVFFLLVTFLSLQLRKNEDFKTTIKEFFLALIIVTFVVNTTGSILGRISGMIGSRPEIYFVYPALMSTVGAVGSIIGSTATTKLALGTVNTSLSEIKLNMPELSGVWASSAILSIIYAATSSFFTNGFIILSQFGELAKVLLFLNLTVTPLISVFSYIVAVIIHKRGLNPDNLVIPLESSLSDTVTTIFLFIALIIFS